MTLRKLWRFAGGIGSPPNRIYDWLRQGVNRRLVAFLCRQLASVDRTADAGTPTSVRVLEAGSGTAFAASLVARQPGVSKSVCMDLDISALVEARERDPQLAVVVGDLMRMPFSKGSFALVFNNSTVEHLADPAGAVGEMRRVCHDTGRVFVGLPYLWGPLIIQRLIRRTALGVWLGSVFSRSSLDRLLRSAGLVPLTHRRYFWNFFIGAVAAKSGAEGAGTSGREAPC